LVAAIDPAPVPLKLGPLRSLLQNHVGGGQRGERRRRSVADK
jgi:hypothetical protein